MENTTISSRITARTGPQRLLVLGIGGGGGRICAAVAERLPARRLRSVYDQSEVNFLAVDTNQTSLHMLREMNVQGLETFQMGPKATKQFGSSRDINVAKAAFEESKADLAKLLSNYDVVLPIATLGKATGTGTIRSFVKMLGGRSKMILPTLIQPSFAQHECDFGAKEQADKVLKWFDGPEGMKVLQVNNDAAYLARTKLRVAYEALNPPIADGLAGLVGFFAAPIDVDISDFVRHIRGGRGRIRIASIELDLEQYKNESEAKLQEEVYETCFDRAKVFQFEKPIGGAMIMTLGNVDNVQLSLLRGGLFKFMQRDDVQKIEKCPVLVQDSEASANLNRVMVTVLFSEKSSMTDAELQQELGEMQWTYLPSGQKRPAISASSASVQLSESSSSPAIPHSPSTNGHKDHGHLGGVSKDTVDFTSLAGLCRGIETENPRAVEIASKSPTNAGFQWTFDDLKTETSKKWFSKHENFLKFSDEWRAAFLKTVQESGFFHEYRGVVTINNQTPLSDLLEFRDEHWAKLPVQIQAELAMRIWVGTHYLRDNPTVLTTLPDSPADKSDSSPARNKRRFGGLGAALTR